MQHTHPSANTMSSESFNFIVCFLFLLACVQMVIGYNPIYHICSTTSGNFPPHSPYESSLNKLLGELRYKTPPTGFGMGSVGLSKAHTSGLSLCGVDVSPKDCMTCVVNASAEIRRSCPRNKAGIIWYDQCLLRYSNSNFLGQIDNQWFSLCNVNHVSDHPKAFNVANKKLLTGLSNKAYSDRKMYASGVISVDDSQKIYGLVQCTRDLSRANCKRCLLQAISELPIYCDGTRIGGRIVGGSCNLRYEIYPFVGL